MSTNRFPAYLGLIVASAWLVMLGTVLPLGTAFCVSVAIGLGWTMVSLLAENVVLPLLFPAGRSRARVPVLRPSLEGNRPLRA